MANAYNICLILLPVLYTLLVSGYARLFTGTAHRVGRYIRPLLWVTVFVHLAAVVFRGMVLGTCPMASLWDFFSLIALSVTITYSAIELRIRNPNSGVFVLAPAFALQLLSSALLLGADLPQGVELGIVPSLQLLSAIVGYSAVAVSAIYGCLYLFLYLAIKRGSFHLFYRRIPDLETLSGQNFLAAIVASIALAASLVFDSLAGAEGPSILASNLLLHRTITVAALGFFGACVVARKFFHLGGKRLAYTTVLGVLFPLALIVAVIARGGIHG